MICFSSPQTQIQSPLLVLCTIDIPLHARTINSPLQYIVSHALAVFPGHITSVGDKPPCFIFSPLPKQHSL